MTASERRRRRDERWRCVLYMTEDGCTTSEIAEVLGCSEHGVHSAAHLARLAGMPVPYRREQPALD
jgi:DNA-directed RNA polymerase specialized sigma24 family protein